MPIRDKVYDKLKSIGLTDSKEDFFKYFDNNESVRKQAYNKLRDAGLTDSEEDFYDYMKPEQTKVQQVDEQVKAEPYTHVYGSDGSLIGGTALQEAGKPREVAPEVTERILANKPDYFKSPGQSLIDIPLGREPQKVELDVVKPMDSQFGRNYTANKVIDTINDVYSGVGYDYKAQKRIENAIEDSKNPEVVKSRTASQMRGLANDVDALLEEAHGKLKKKVPVGGNAMNALMSSRQYGQDNASVRQEISKLDAAKRLLEQSQNVVDEAGKKGKTNFVAGTLRGFWDNLEGEDFTFGAADASSSASILNALEKVEEGKPLTDAEDALLKASAINMAVQYHYANDLGEGYKAGGVTAESVPFMLEMLINPIAGFGKASAKTLLNYGLKAFAKNAVKGLAKGAVAGAGMAATTGLGNVVSGMNERLSGNYDYMVDNEGKLHVDKKDEVMGSGEALARSFASRAIENQSEMIFRAFDGAGQLLKGVQKYIPGGVNKFFSDIAESKVGQLYKGIKNSPLRKELAEATQIGDLGEEWLEEVYSNLAHFGIGEMEWKDVVSLDKNIETLLGLAPTQAMFAMLGLGGMGMQRYNNRKSINNAFGKMSEEQKAKLKELQEMGKLNENKDIAEFIKITIADKNLTPEEKRAEIEYAYNLAKQNAINEVSEVETQDRVEADNASIDAATDTQTGNYAQVTAIFSDGAGGTKEVVGNVVGWIGDSPIFVADGMENTEENRRVLKQGEWNPETLIARPAEEVKAINEDIIREEVAAQAERESKYAPEVLSRKMEQGIPFETADAIYLPIQPMAEGNGWTVEVQPKATNNKTASKSEVIELTNDEFYDLLQADLEAQETVQAEIAQSESVGEQVNAPVNTEVNNPMENTESTPMTPMETQGSTPMSPMSTPMSEEVQSATEEKSTQPQAEQQKQPTLEEVVATLPKNKKGEIDYKSMTAQQQYQYTSLTESPEVALEDLQADIAAGQEEIAKKQEQLSKARGGERAALRDEVRKLTQAQAELQSFYDSVASNVEEETPIEEVTEPTAQEEVQPTEAPVQTETVEEVVSEEEQRRRPLRERAKEWSDALGVDVTIYESVDDIEDEAVRQQVIAIHNSKKLAPGWVTDGKVYFLMSDMADVDEIDNTYIHEVVAHIGMEKLLGKERFAELCDKVWEMMPQSAKDYFYNYPEVSNIKDETARRRKAADEYIASLAEKENLTPEEQTIWDSIVKMFRDMLDRALNGIIGKSKLTDEDISNLIKASYANLKNKAETTPVTSVTEAAAQEKPSISFNVRTEAELQEKIRKFASSNEGKETGWTTEQIESIIEETSALINALDATLRGNRFYDEFADREPTIRTDWRDGEAKPVVTWTRANIEYKYDMSADLLCINNDGMEAVLSSPKMAQLMKMLPTTPVKDASGKKYNLSLTSSDYLSLYAIMKDMGFVVPCKGCFDAAGRLKMLPSVAQKFAADVNSVVDERNKNPKKFDDELKKKAEKDKQKSIEGLPVTAKTKMDAIRSGVAGDNLTEHIDWTDLMTAEGQAKILAEYGGIFRAWQRTGAGRPKDKLPAEPYIGDITSSTTTIIGAYGDKTPSFRDIYVNEGTGLRRNSHSELRPYLAVDEIQFMRDAFIRNLTVFKYMKELDDVRLFGKMGVKFNMSFFPEFVKGTKAAGLDINGDYIASEESVGAREFSYQGEDGKMHYDGMKGWAEAQKYVNKDVSLSSVVFSIPHLLKALTDVPTPSNKAGIWGSLIPFHSSGATTAQLAAQGLGNARANGIGHGFEEALTDYGRGVTNFEAVQNDRFQEGWVILAGKKKGEAVEPGHKLEFVNGTHYYNENLGVHLFPQGYALDSEIPIEERSSINTKEGKAKYLHNFSVDYNEKVREIGTPTAYKDAADYYLDVLPKIGISPRFDFVVPENIFLQMCADVNVDPRHPKLGWKGEGNNWNPIDSEAYYSMFCDYGMTDPATGEWASHRPVGYINENGEREFRLPENTQEIVEAGVNRYTEVRDREDQISDDAIRAFADEMVSQGRLNQEQVDKVLGETRFRFIGEKGARNLDKAEEATTRLDNLSVAREMETAKKDAKTIKMATGWERGADGLWRYETKDIELNGLAWVNKKKPLKWSDVIVDDELFVAYPELADVRVKKGRGFSGGSYSHKGKELEINLGRIRKNIEWFGIDGVKKEVVDDIKDTIIHELQHAIQDIEGFAPGGNSSTIADKSILNKIDELNAEIGELFAEWDRMPAIEKKFSNPVARQIDNRVGYLKSEVLRLYKERAIGSEGYKRLAGEVEARNVASRMDMSEEERRNTLAIETEDVARKDQIFLKDGIESGIRLRVAREPAIDYVSQANDVVEVPKDEVMYTMNNIASQLYKTSGRFMRQLYQNGTLGRVLKGDYAEIDQIKAKNEYDHAKPILDEYLNELVWMKYQATDAAQEVINGVISDVEYAIKYYKDLSLGKDVWRTEERPRFRIVEKQREDVNKGVDSFTSKYNSKPVSVATSDMTDEELEKAVPTLLVEDTRKAIEEGAKGKYSVKADKIYIFADNVTKEELEDTLFHENLHPMFSGNPIIEEFYANFNAKYPEQVKMLAEGYEESEVPEEVFVTNLAVGMQRGNFKMVEPFLAESSREDLYNTLKAFGYDYEQERGRRNPERNSGKGSDVAEGKKVANRSRGKEDSEGQRESSREQAEKLRDLFGRVADMGLDGVLGNEAYDRAMMDIYSVLPEDSRKEVIDDAFNHYGMNIAPAVSDYIHGKSDGNILDKIVAIIRNALRKVGFDIDLNGNEVKYLAWRSKKPLDRSNLVDMAEDIYKRYQLKVGEYSTNDDGTTPDGGGTRFRTSEDVLNQIKQARKEVEKDPSEAQKEAGNYKKGHITLDGFEITLENPKGGTRSGVDKNGKKWSITMNNDYGYIRGTEAVDGDHIDVFLSDNPTEGRVFVVDQSNEDGTFDESKVMYGFNSLDEARNAYLSNYEKGWEKRIMDITEVSKEEFKKWIDSSHRKIKAFSEYKSINSNNDDIRFRTVYHGTGVSFDKFDHSFMGTGEGNQSFGWGTYVTDVEGVARIYASNHPYVTGLEKSRLESELYRLKEAIPFRRGEALEESKRKLEEIENKLANMQDAGRHLYYVEIPDNDGTNYISWDKMLPKEHAERIKEAVRNSTFFKEYEKDFKQLAEERLDAWTKTNGGRVYKLLGNIVWNEKDLSQILSKAGFVGIEYPTNYMSGGNENGHKNYVIFDEKDLEIKEHTRFKVKEAKKEKIADLRAEISDLKREVANARKNSQEEWESNQRAIISFIKGKLTKEAGEEFGKYRIDQLLNLVNKATTAKDLRKPFQFIEQVINSAIMDREAARMEKLIKTKLQGETSRGVAKGVVVDESTRRLFDSIRGTFKDLISTSIDSELRHVRSEILRFGKEINDLPKDDIQGRSILTAQQEALKERRKELEAEQEELRKNNVVETKESLKKRYDELVDAMDAHIDGNGAWTIEMQDEYDSIPLREKLAEIREAQAQLDDILTDALNTRRAAYGLKGGERKKMLAEADILDSNYSIAQEELIRLMSEVSRDLEEIIKEGKSRLASRKEALDERRRKIVSMGIGAVKDRKVIAPNTALTKEEKWHKWFDNSGLKKFSDFMTAPLNSFNFLLKYIDRNHTIGEGELYNYFMKSQEGALEANNRLYDGLKAYNTAIEEKAKEIFGKSIEKVMKDSGKEYNDRVTKQYMFDSTSHREGERYPIRISKGQALYVWLTWRQEDGRAKLLADGWTEESIAEIEDLIGGDYMKFGEWITDEFFPQLREEKYNKTHIEMFGTSMAKREHYFPFKVNAEDIQEKGEMGESYEGMPSTITGNIIKRTINKSRINTEQNAFDLLYKYGNDMETWNAMAKLRQDLNFLHASKAFRNYMEANSKGLFNTFMKAAEVAVKAYNNSAEANPINDFFVKLNRMWAGSNIGFRLNTAMKQILSYPAFMAYSGNPKFQINLGKYMLNWKGNYDWAKENLPAFRQRIETGDMGMTGMTDPQFDFAKYFKKFTDAGMIPNQLVDALTCAAGARSVYDFEYNQAIKNGLSEEEAKNVAQYNAEVAFNETQQSSREEFVSPIQMSRNVLIKSMMNYQNSNVGYQRMGNEGLLEIMRAKRVYEQDLKNGMNEAEAKKKMANSIARGTRKAMVAFTILPGLWYLGGRGIVGITAPLISSLFGGGGDDEPYLDDEAKVGLLVSIGLGTVAGTAGGQLIGGLVQGREYNPMAWMNEMQKDIVGAVNNGWNMNTTKNIALRLAKFGGVNMETWENIYLGAEHAIRTGNFDLVDFMMLINLPASQRKAMAEELYSDMPFMEYADKVSRAQKLFDDYRKYLPYAKTDKNGSKSNAIKKQYIIENLSEEKQDKLEKEKEFKKLQREYGQAEDKAEWLEEHPEYDEMEKDFKPQKVTKEVNREAKKLK